MKILNRIVFFGLLFICLGILALIGIGMVQDQAERQARAEAAEATRVAVQTDNLGKYGEDLMALCDNPDATVNGIFPVFEQTPRVLVLQTGTNSAHAWHASQTSIPQNASEVDLVLCVPPSRVGERTTVEVCPYEDTEATVTRYRVDPQVIALLPSGETVAVTTLEGSAPGRCPFSIQVGGQQLTEEGRVVLGGLPAPAAAFNWVHQQVEQAQLAQTLRPEMMGLCRNVPQTTAEAPNFAIPPQLIILDYGHDSIHEWHVGLPSEWKSDNPTVVACVTRLHEVQYNEIQTCSFMMLGSGDGSVSGSRDVPMMMPYVQIALIDPESGVSYGNYTLEGYNDNFFGCPQTLSNPNEPAIYLKKPTVSMFQQWFTETFGES